MQRFGWATVILVLAVSCGPIVGPPAVPVAVTLTPEFVTLSAAVPQREVRLAYEGPPGTTVTITAEASDDAVSVVPPSVVVPAGGEATVTVSYDPARLDPDATATVVFRVPGVDDLVLEILVAAAIEGCFIVPGEPLPSAVPVSTRAATRWAGDGPGVATDHVPGQLLVTYESAVATTLATRAAVAATADVRVLRAGGAGGHDLVEVPDGDLDGAAARLRADPRVAHVSRNYVAHRLALPDTFYGTQWYLADFGLEAVWQVEDAGGAGSPVVVAMLDDGVNVEHVDLAGKAEVGRDVYCDDPDVRTLSLHGTHVAGVAVAASSPDGLVVGVAKGARARLLAVKVFPDDPGLGGTLDAVVRGIRWAAGLAVDGVPPAAVQADVINMSLGFGTALSPGAVAILGGAVDAARGRGIVLVAAAGNEGSSGGVVYPARLPGVIAVGSIDWEFTRSTFSTYGEGLDLMAPGGSAPAEAVAGETCLAGGRVSLVGVGTPGPRDVSCQSGTSMSSAFVAGTAALLIASDEGAYRGDPDAITVCLLVTAAEPDTYSPEEFGAGVVSPDAVFGLGTVCTLPPEAFGP